jgi:hypothetical protein
VLRPPVEFTLWLAVGVGSDVGLPLSMFVPPEWSALPFFSALLVRVLGVLAVAALLVALRRGVAADLDDSHRAAAAPPIEPANRASDDGQGAGDLVLPDLVRVSRPPGPGRGRHPRRQTLAILGALAMLSALVATNAGLVPGRAKLAAPALSPSPMTQQRATASPPASSHASPAQPGVVLDRADFGFGVGGGWSPDGRAYADVAQVSATDTEVHVVAADGRRLLTVPGEGVAWVDADHVAVAGPYLAGGGSTEVRIHPVHVGGTADASQPITLGPPYASVRGTWSTWMLGNGHGAVALVPWTLLAPAPASPGGPMPTFRVWSADGGLSGPADGSPAAWSPDGSRLAAWLPPASTAQRSDGGVVLAATGSPTPGMAAVYDARLRTLASFPVVTLDTRMGLRWSPDGAWLVGSRIPTATTPGGPVLLPVPSGADGTADGRSVEQIPADVQALGWISGSELLVARAGMLATWQTAPAPGRLVAAIPDGAVARQLPDGATLVLAAAQPLARVWSPAGSTVLGPADDGSITPNGLLAYQAEPSGPAGELRAIPVAALPEVALPPVLGAPVPLAGCRPIDAASVTAGFAVVLSSDHTESTGILDGRHLGPADIAGQPWRQPSTDPLDVAAGTGLTLRARPAEGGTPWCIGAASVTAAAFSSVNAPPDQPHELGGTSEPASGLMLAALPEGDWVVRADVSAQTIDGSTADETAYLRVRVGLPPAPAPVPAGPPAVPCRPGPTSPPGVTLAAGPTTQAGTIGASTWRATAVEIGSEPLPTSVATLPAGSGAEIRVAGDACALAWSIGYAAIPASDGPVIYDLLGMLAAQANPALDPSFARQDRVRLAPIPWGDWVVRAELTFADGQVVAYWRVHVPGPTGAEAQAAARQVAVRFERAVYTERDAAAAWPLLSPLSQRAVGGQSGWTGLAAQLASSAGATWFIESVAQGTGDIKAVFVALADDVRATADAREAFVVGIDHRRASDGASSFDQLIVAPLLDGSDWRVWQVR